MQFKAKPVLVEAFVITSIDPVARDGSVSLVLTDRAEGRVFRRTATKEMLSRIMPAMGDYWVVQADGYEYLNPREVFDRKYERAA